MQAYLDRQPNHFDQDFRETLFRHSAGNALFTVELLHAMQARGEVVQDTAGRWVQRYPINWEQLPARVEAVIAEQISQLDRECINLLKAACVQGEVFTAGPLAQVHGTTVQEVISNLSGPLCQQHFLVTSHDLSENDSDRQTHYKFRCLLFQKYLYQNLDKVERKFLQHFTENALEKVVVK